MIEKITFSTMVSRSVERYGSRVAVVDDKRSITYTQLEQRANAIAHQLTETTAGRNDFVAMLLPQCVGITETMLATQKAGCAIVMCSTLWPAERINRVLSDCGASVIVTSRNIMLQADYKRIDTKGITVLYLDDVDYNRTAHIDLSEEELNGQVFYTSGTTGIPKGVVFTMRAVYHINTDKGFLNQYAEKAYAMAAVTDVSFIASAFLFMPLFYGGCTYMMRREYMVDQETVAKFIRLHAISTMFMPTSFGVSMLKQYNLKLQLLILGGEKLTGLTQECLEKGPVVFQIYGNTEGAVFLPTRITNADDTKLSLMREGSEVYILDDDMREVGLGEVGDLYVLSDTNLFKCYLNNPELTAQKLVDCPFKPEKKMFRVGDRVRRTETGYIIVGRADDVIKLGAWRIETGEIEAIASAFEGVGRAVCVLKHLAARDALCLYFEAAEATKVIDTDTYRNYLADRLPYYMVPAVIIQLPRLPLNQRGKVDRKILPDPECQPIELPATEDEQKLYDIVCDLIGTSAFGVTTNLRDLGIDSMLFLQIEVEAKAKGVMVTALMLMAQGTIRKALDVAYQQVIWKGYSEKKPVAVIVMGDNVWSEIEHYVDALTDTYSVMIIDSVVSQCTDLLKGATRTGLIAYYVSLVKTYMPADKELKLVTGHCLGGELAYCLAQEWHKSTGQLPRVVMLDTFLRREIEGMSLVYRKPADDNPWRASYEELFDMLALIGSIGYFDHPQTYQGEMMLIRSTLPDPIPPTGTGSSLMYLLSPSLIHYGEQLKPTIESILGDETLKTITQMVYSCVNSINLWSRYVPDIKIVDVDAGHISMLEPQHINKYIDKVIE